MTTRRLWTPITAALALAAPAAWAAEPGPPREAVRLVGDAAEYKPLGFTPRLHLAGRVEDYGGFVVDRYGTTYDYDTAVNTQLRVGLGRVDDFTAGRLVLEYEHDFLAGTVSGGGVLEGELVPDSGGYEDQTLRKLWASFSFGQALTIGGGFTTSHWGLGLLANDGAHGARPGHADFVDPRGGDRVLRALVATGPHSDMRLVVFAAFDEVQGDDVLYPGDEAIQAVAGARVGDVAARSGATPYEGGVYGVWRRQEASDGQRTTVGVVDVYARHLVPVGDMQLDLAFEGALVVGETELAPSVEHTTHDVMQLGARLSAGLDAGCAGAALDVVYASGDQRFDDEQQNGFKLDINSELGLVLFRQVIAAQTARSPVTASDLDLVGVPNEDLDRLPTRGNVTNTIAFFPRGWWRPVDGLELYGGVLVALSEVPYSDAFNARLAGGAPRNPTNGAPGTYLGTELDVGLRWRALIGGTELALGLEGGLLLPGSALADADGVTPDPILGGRAMAQYRF